MEYVAEMDEYCRRVFMNMCLNKSCKFTPLVPVAHLATFHKHMYELNSVYKKVHKKESVANTLCMEPSTPLSTTAFFTLG